MGNSSAHWSLSVEWEGGVDPTSSFEWGDLFLVEKQSGNKAGILHGSIAPRAVIPLMGGRPWI